MASGFTESDPHVALESEVARAEAQCHAGRWNQAVATYRHLLARRLRENLTRSRDGVATAADAVIVERLAELALLNGQGHIADQLLSALGLALRRVENRFAADFVALKRLHLAISSCHRGNIDALLQELSVTIGSFEDISFVPSSLDEWENRCWGTEIQPEKRNAFFAQFYLEAGRLFCFTGQYQDALAALGRGLKHSGSVSSGSTSRGRLPLEIERAAALLEFGDPAGAQTVLEGVEPSLNSRKHPGFFVRAQELNAKLAMMRGNFGLAYQRFAKARDFCRSNGFERACAVADANFAQLLILLNQTLYARELLAEGVRLARQLGEDALTTRLVRLQQLAEARRRSAANGFLIAPAVSELWAAEGPANADRRIERVMSAFGFADSGTFLDRFQEFALGFQWMLDGHDFQRAKEWSASMHEIFAVSDSPLIILRLHILDAILKFYDGSYIEAATIFDRLCPELRSRGLKHELWQVGRFLTWCQERAPTKVDLDVTFKEEIDKLLADMTGSLDPEQQVFFHLNKWTDDEARFARRVDELMLEEQKARRRPRFLRLPAKWRLLKKVSSLIHDLDRWRSASTQTGFAEGAPQPVARARQLAWWQELALQPFRQATVSFLALPDRLLITQSRFLSISFGISPITRLQLRELISAWHKAVAADAEAQSEMSRIAEELGMVLQLPELLSALPATVRKLRIVADDSLNVLPFAALRIGGRYLVESHAVSMALMHFGSRRRQTLSTSPRLLAVGVTREIAGYPPLPGVESELHQVTEWGETAGVETCVLRDDTAQKEAVTRELQKATLAHFACHGVFSRGDLAGTGLLLIPVPDCRDLLSVFDIAGLKLDGLQHVTLSSCWSADNFLLPGWQVISLPQTFIRAGAKSVLGNFWSVSDDVAPRFFEAFYAHLLKLTPDEALRSTQLACLNNSLVWRLSTADPFFWAGYCVYGETRSPVFQTRLKNPYRFLSRIRMAGPAREI